MFNNLNLENKIKKCKYIIGDILYCENHLYLYYYFSLLLNDFLKKINTHTTTITNCELNHLLNIFLLLFNTDNNYKYNKNTKKKKIKNTILFMIK